MEKLKKFSKTIDGVTYIKEEIERSKNQKIVQYINKYWTSGIPFELLDEDKWVEIKELR